MSDREPPLRLLQERTDSSPVNFDAIGREDLLDDARLALLYLEAVRRGFVSNSAYHMLEFAAMAEKAVRDDKLGTPGRLFYALVKAKDGSRISEASEFRAMQRFPSHVRDELVARGASLPAPPAGAIVDPDEALFPVDNIGFSHAVMVQCFLPQQRLPKGTVRHVSRHGRASLAVTAGLLAKPDSAGEFVACEVPFGPKPRLIIPYIVGQAVRNDSPHVDLGESLRRFMGRLGVSIGGSNGRALTQQVEYVAAAQVIVGAWEDEAAHTYGGQIAKQVSFWVERDARQRTFWTPSMTLSDDFFHAVKTHRVPVNMSHLARLGRSARRMDLYVWLAYRTYVVRKRVPVAIPLQTLWPVFGPDLGRLADFRARLVRDLRAIRNVYPHFAVEVDGQLLRLRRSPPPVNPRVSLQVNKDDSTG